jgi:hypothetical protein
MYGLGRETPRIERDLVGSQVGLQHVFEKHRTPGLTPFELFVSVNASDVKRLQVGWYAYGVPRTPQQKKNTCKGDRTTKLRTGAIAEARISERQTI